MERSCYDCKHRPSLSVSGAVCVRCEDQKLWEPKSLFKPIDISALKYCSYDIQPTLDTLKNMDVASLYPKFEKPIYIGTGPALPINNEVLEYMKRDVELTKELFETPMKKYMNFMCKPEIKKVVFNDPATIVFWTDGSKTVVKTQEGDIFDPEKGLAMAISKKVMGNNGRYYEEFKKWLPEETVKEPEPCRNFDCFMEMSKAARTANDNLRRMTEGLFGFSKNTVSPVRNEDDEWKRAIAEYLLGTCEKEVKND